MQAPRGPILDRNGDVLVTNIPGRAVQIWSSDLPKRRGVRLREIRALARVLGLPANQIGAAIRRHRHDPLTPIRIKDSASRDQVFYLEERAEDFPGVQIVPAYLRYYPNRELGRARARLRQRDLAGAGEGAAQAGVQRRRHDRPDRDRVVLRQVPTWDRRRLAVARRLARQADQPGRAEGPGASRQRGPPDARREAAEGRGGRAAVRHRPRAQLAVLRLLVLERRRDRRARPAGRLDARARVVPDVPAVALRRSRAPAGARRRRADAAHGRGDELPGARPRDQRRVSAGLDVQARHGDRGDAGAHPPAVRAPRVHRLRTRRTARSSRTGIRS